MAAAASRARPNRLAEIARKNYTNKDIDDDEDDATGTPSPYSIDMNAEQWQNIDFGRVKQQGSGKFKSSPLNSAQMAVSSSTTALSGGVTNANDILKMLDEIPEFNRTAPVISTSTKSDPDEIKPEFSRSLSKRISPQKAAVEEMEASRLAAERAELKRMMDELQAEKVKLASMTAFDSEKKKVQDEEAKMAIKERDELRSALATMRAKNTWLSKTMEKTEQEAQEQLAKERSHLASELQRMEEQNRLLTKKVLEGQEEAERRLAQEKQAFRDALKAMEAEKMELAQRVLATENEARREAQQVAAQRDEFQRKVLEMQSEQQQLAARVQENETRAKTASAAIAEQLAKEREALNAQLAQMAAEKTALASSLSEIELAAASHAQSLEKKLAAERAELQAALDHMDKEKQTLSQSLTAAEQAAKQQAEVVANQLQKEKEELAATLARMEQEKRDLAERLKDNERNVQDHVVKMSSAAEQLAAEKEALRRQMEQMAKEREQLEQELALSRERALQEEREKEARLAQERDELRMAVERMKKEMELEKEQQRMLFDAAFTADDAAAGGGGGGSDSPHRSLIAKKSLYDVMTECDAPPPQSPAPAKLQSVLSRQIMTIKESHNEAQDEELSQSAKLQSTKESPSKAPSAAVATKQQPQPVKGPPATNVPPEMELPAPHLAASKGDTQQLKMFWEMQETLLSSTDKFGRNPLFYAVAYDQHEAAAFLLEVVPDTVMQLDVHGDSPLHAAASAGSGRCIELLIRAARSLGEELVEPINKMGMAPAHLAKSASAMEALYSNGADLKIRDLSNRTPLFIAAAMNRSDCVQYIIDNCLEGDDDALYASDARGDTPLHAAACNGASECLLLLLQCGINPLTPNTAGLRAIDLAQRNKKSKCREILGQYHLHFATASDFDSVGFVATLEVGDTSTEKFIYF
jgi:ankyrin repeat protein